MRRAVLALVVTAVAVVLLASYRTHPPRQAPPRPPALHARPTGTPEPLARIRGARTASGPVITTPFSVIQVEATVKGSRLIGVRTIALTGDGPHTQALNARAEPILRREALRAGSAQIDVVSGATYTSESWIASLRAAMRRARG
jgi:uncharacterized protein with FMN-binding domain